MTLQEILQKRAQLIAEARQLVDRAEKENRALTAEEDGNYKKYLSDAAELNERAQRQRDVTELGTGMDAPFTRDALVTGDGQTTPDAKVQRDAFVQFLKRGREAMSGAEQRALQVGVDTTGGYLVVPEQMAVGMIQAKDNLVWMRAKATKFAVPRAQSLGMVSLDADPADPTWTSELATGSEDSTMSFGKRKLEPTPLAKRIKVSNALLDMASGIESLVMARLAYKFGTTEEYAFLLGTGANQPLGVFVASNDGITTARDFTTGNTATSIKVDGLKGAKYTLKAQYRGSPSCGWMFHRDAIAQISQLKDGSGQYLWQPSLVLGEPDRLLNLPVQESEYVPNTFTASQYVGILGDFSYYYIADAMAIRMQRLNELYAETNQTGFIARAATDGMPALAEAFVRVKLST